MLETEKPVEKIQDIAKLNDFDLDKFRKMQNITTNIVKPQSQEVAPQRYQAKTFKPSDTNITQIINSGGF